MNNSLHNVSDLAASLNLFTFSGMMSMVRMKLAMVGLKASSVMPVEPSTLLNLQNSAASVALGGCVS